MATKKKAPVVTRKARINTLRPGLHVLDLAITTNGKAAEYSYYLEDLGTDADHDEATGQTSSHRCFRLHKSRLEAVEGEPSNYDVRIDVDPTDPEHPSHSCECMGFLRWNHCKHTDALAAIVAAKKIAEKI